ncbi:MAG: diguanylate cyclase domain-containing protein [Acidimicrobiales bacterium]
MDEDPDAFDAVLQLALDLCVSTGAFLVNDDGEFHGVVSDAMPPDNGLPRVEALARSCLQHPGAHGRELFWNAEVMTEAVSADTSLACVVVPVWTDDVQIGLLGVVDTWLPEPDAEQRVGLGALADEIGRLVARRPGRAAPAPAWTPAVPSVPTGDLGAAALAATPELSPLLAGLVDELPDGLVVTRSDGTIVLVNRALLSMTGLSADELLHRHVASVLMGGPAPGRVGNGHTTEARQLPTGRRRLVTSGPGEPLEVEARSEHVTGRFAGDWTVTVLRPVEPQGRAVELAAAELAGFMDDGIMLLDRNGTVVLANQTANMLHGLPAGRSLVGSPLPEATALRTEDGHVVAIDHHPGLMVVHDGIPRTARMTLGDGDESRRLVTVTARPVSGGGVEGALVVLHDTTEEWIEQQRLTHYALHDPLTNLANRYLLLEEIRRMLQGLVRRGGSVALVFIDLDHFKRINDDYGHDVGDEALTAVARRLVGAVRGDDVVARLGGDEFVIAHVSTDRKPDGDLMVSRVRKVLSAPFRLRGQAFDVGASIGWVSTDTADIGPDELLAKADRAMYLHKRDRPLVRGGVA